MRLRRRDFLILSGTALVSACGGPVGARSAHAFAWGHEGWGEGQFLRPRAVGVHGDRVFVVDTTGRVQVFDFDGGFVTGWKTPSADNGTPTAVSFDPDGRVLVPDTHYSQILEYDAAGELLEKWGTYGSGPEQFIYPTDIARGANGEYFISEYGENAERVHVFDSSRRFLRQWGTHGDEPGQFSRAMALEVSTANEVFVADTANHRIQSFDGEGRPTRIISSPGVAPGQLKFPYDIALAPNGTLLVSEYGTHRISHFDGNGVFIAAYGAAGRGPGEFNGPRGVAISPEGLVFVADTDNHRMQRIEVGGLL